MHIKTGLLALILGASVSTAAFAQYYENPRDDRSGGGYSNQGRSQSQGGGRYDPSTGGRYPADERAWRYERRWRDYDGDDYYRYRYRYRDRDYDDRDHYYDRW